MLAFHNDHAQRDELLRLLREAPVPEGVTT